MRNGTHEELDAAREDATLLPKNAKFIAKTASDGPGDLIGKAIVYRPYAENPMNNKSSVLFNKEDETDFWYLDFKNLEIIHD